LGFTSFKGDNVRNYTKSWENQDVHLWVAKKSKEMLVKNRVSTTCRIKKGGVEVTVC